MSLAPKNQVLKNQRERVLAVVQRLTADPTVGCTLRDVCTATGLDDRIVDRALQYWKKEGSLIFRTKKQASRNKPAGWSVS